MLQPAMARIPVQTLYSAKARIPTRDSVKIRRKTVEHSIVCLTSIDTANALADCLALDKTIQDVDLIDITKI